MTTMLVWPGELAAPRCLVLLAVLIAATRPPCACAQGVPTYGSVAGDMPWQAASTTTLAAQPPGSTSLRAGCSGRQEETRPCSPVTCGVSAAPVDCIWGDWAVWAACDCGGTQQRFRSVQKEGGNGGELCSGPEREMQACKSDCATADAVDCLLGTWDSWSHCTRTCQSGQQYRTREVERRQKMGGNLCMGSLHETQACNLQDCPDSQAVDCQWQLWSVWSQCSLSCGMGEHRRSRAVEIAPLNGGRLCEAKPTAEVARCGKPCDGTGMDCKWSHWTDWSACSKSCGGGQQYRIRSIARKATAKGVGCQGRFTDFRDCAIGGCSSYGQDCVFASWSQWTFCSAHCNGHHARTRSISITNRNGGDPCSGASEEMTPCNTGADSCLEKNIDCRYSSWDEWSPCTQTCGGGNSEHKRSITVHSSGVGRLCDGDLRALRRCNSKPCKGSVLKDCQWSPWGRWSVCTATCGGGQKRRRRTIVVEAVHGGQACESGAGVEVSPCHVEHCVEKWQVCEWSRWDSWSDCMRSGMIVECGGGQQKHSRKSKTVMREVDSQTLQKVKKNSLRRLMAGNVACNQLQDEVRACAQKPCDKPQPRSCSWGAWDSWSPCPCNGMQERHRVIKAYARNGGPACVGPELQSQPCKPHCHFVPTLDCLFSSWTEWSDCPVTCGGGKGLGFLVRYRSVVQNAEGSGHECSGRSQEQQPCNQDPCPPKQDCVWGRWTEDSACSKTCGGGEKSRTRTVLQSSQNGGRPCARKDSMRVEACSMQPCPTSARDCELSAWNDWQACSVHCGGGLQHRSRSVLVEAAKDGIQCSGQKQDFRRCGTKPCWSRPKIDCLWGQWSSWSACTALCNGHQERNRAIARMAVAGGVTCDGPERTIRPCNLKSPTCTGQLHQDCKLGTWNEWTPCTKPCSGGQHFRNREVQVHARNNGKPCLGSLQQAHACNMKACAENENADCKWDQWGSWSACSKSCEGGQRTHLRGIAVEPRPGGRPCKAQASMEMRPCNTGRCGMPQERCGWGRWMSWSACTVTCDGGQQQHARQRQWVAERPSPSTTKAGGQSVSPYGSRRLVAPPSLANANDCAGTQQEIRPCGIMPCNGALSQAQKPCSWASWSDWNDCSCQGLVERDRVVGHPATGGGLACVGPARETRTCKPLCDQFTMDCQLSEWQDWGQCTVTCGGGQTKHVRIVQRQAQGYGAGCHGTLSEVQACSTQPCGLFRDCSYDDWTPWTGCSRSCGSGQKSRSRVMHNPLNGGEPCKQGPLSSVVGCNTKSCDEMLQKDCEWGQWESWSPCSASCGDGRRGRRREIQTPVKFGGKPCVGVFQEYRNCQLASCNILGIDCRLWDWSTWSHCSQPCIGHRERVRDIEIYAVGTGKPCNGPLRVMKTCSSDDGKACHAAGQGRPGSADCQMSDWAKWSDCSHRCGTGQRFSSRRIKLQARGTGKACDGDLRRTLPCFLKACKVTGPVDCKWGDWGGLSHCSASCGGGQWSRSRKIVREAAGGGFACPTAANLEVLPCKTQPCDDQDCAWSPWTRWEPCSASCGGQTKRRRALHWTKIAGDTFQAWPGPASAALSQYDSGALVAAASGDDDPLRSFMTAHGPSIFAFAAFGAVSMLLATAMGMAQLPGVDGPLRTLARPVVAASWPMPLGLMEVGPSTPQAEVADVSRHPGDDFALYAALDTEDPWELGCDDVERPAFRAPDL